MDKSAAMPEGSYAVTSDSEAGHTDNVDQMMESMKGRMPTPRGVKRLKKRKQKKEKKDEEKRLLEMSEAEVESWLRKSLTLGPRLKEEVLSSSIAEP